MRLVRLSRAPVVVFQLLCTCLAFGQGSGALSSEDTIQGCLSSTAVSPDLIADHAGNLVQNAKNRFISFTAGDGGQSQAIRVIFSDLPAPYDVWNGQFMWVGPPDEYSHSGSFGFDSPCPCFPGPTFFSAELQCTPYYTNWTAIGTVHIRGEAIIPGADYCVQVIDASCTTADESGYSSPSMIMTGLWGDVTGPYVGSQWTAADYHNNILDFFFANKVFAGFPDKSRVDLVGVTQQFDPILDGVISVSDIVHILFVFRGDPAYPFAPSVSALCPGNLASGSACSIGPFVCGNGAVEPGEVCDDGNVWPGDGCNEMCRIEGTCGNAIVEANEECDDGNIAPGDGCNEHCRLEGSAVISIIPVSSTAASTINGNAIDLEYGGQSVTFEVYIADWDPDLNTVPLLNTFQVQIDATSYASGFSGMLMPTVVPCTSDAECRARWGGFCVGTGEPCLEDSECLANFCEGSSCSYPLGVGGFCEPAFMHTSRDDYVLSLPGPTPILDVSRPDIRFAHNSNFSGGAEDPGIPGYAGTFILDVPSTAGGTFTIGMAPGPTQTLMADPDGALIPLDALQPAILTVPLETKFSQPLFMLPLNGDFEAGFTVDAAGDDVPDGWLKSGGDPPTPPILRMINDNGPSLPGTQCPWWYRSSGTGRHITIYQNFDPPIVASDYASLELSLDVKVISHTLVAGGTSVPAFEWPVRLDVAYRRASDPTLSQRWRHGWYLASPGDGIRVDDPGTGIIPVYEDTLVPANVWTSHTFDLFAELPDLGEITQIMVGGAGWGYEGQADNLVIIAGVTEAIPSSIDLSNASPNSVVADDFISDGRPITGVRWWGGSIDYESSSCLCSVDTDGVDFCHLNISDPPNCLLVTPCTSNGDCLPEQRCDPNNTCQSGGGCVFDCTDTRCEGGLTCLTTPPPPEGWLIGFHEPLSISSIDKNAGVSSPLGLYYCEHDAVVEEGPAMTGCDERTAISYTVALDDCCLIAANVDGRSDSVPATTDFFQEEACFQYAISIQAATGVLYEDDGTGHCTTVAGGSPISDDFWGWQTTDREVGAEFGFHQAVASSVTSVGTGWTHGPWTPEVTSCSLPNMAFELITSATPDPDPDGNGNGVPDVCEPCIVLPEAATPEVPTIEKTRYVSFEPNNIGEQTALRLRFVDLPGDYAEWNNKTMWVANPKTVTESSGSSEDNPPPTFTTASLSCQQDCRDWGALGLIDVFGEGVIPEGFYEVQVIKCVCDPTDELKYSEPLSLTTSAYGDLVGQFDSASCGWTPPNGIVAIPFDTVADIDKFSNQPCAVMKARADLVGVPPNRACVDQVIGVIDYAETIIAFHGGGYPFSPSDPDPCNALPCPNP